MSSTVSTTTGGVVVVTHVHPAPGGAVAPAAAAAAAEQPQQYVGLLKFMRCRPQALGTIQILIGLLIFLVGIAWSPMADSIGVYSGIFVWGAGFYVTAGSLTVAAGRRATRCLVNCALSFSIVAAFTATTAVILYGLDAGVMFQCYGWYPDYPSDYDCFRYMSRMQGVSGVLVVFNFLELIVAVVTASYGCCATCSCHDEQPSVVVVHGQTATFPTVTQQMQNMQKIPEPLGFTLPPEPPMYSS